jgi:hypothetical protein
MDTWEWSWDMGGAFNRHAISVDLIILQGVMLSQRLGIEGFTTAHAVRLAVSRHCHVRHTCMIGVQLTVRGFDGSITKVFLQSDPECYRRPYQHIVLYD